MMNVIKEKKLTWVDIKGPMDKDAEWLKNNFDLHPLVLRELLPHLDFPKIENFGDYVFIVIFYPFFEKETSQTIPFELDIIISKNYIITSHYKDIVPLKAIFDKCNLYEDARAICFEEGTGGILFQIFQEILKAYFPKLGRIKENIENVEKMVYRKQNKETVAQISLINRDIVGFQRIIELQELVIKNLEKESGKLFDKKTIPYFHNLMNLHNQASSLLAANLKTLSSLDSTNQSLLTTKTNEVIKILTIFSVILLPLAFIVQLFGMSITSIPLNNHPYGFWIVTGITAFFAFIMTIFFKMKKWL